MSDLLGPVVPGYVSLGLALGFVWTVALAASLGVFILVCESVRRRG